MLNDRRRILELALESLELKKIEIDKEIAEIKGELQGKAKPKKPAPKQSTKRQKKTSRVKAAPKNTRFTKEERLRRSQRMKEYWEKWRKNKERTK